MLRWPSASGAMGGEVEGTVRVATPTLSVPVPKVAAPSLKVTVPVGVPEPGALAVTVAVNVTDWPKTDGAGAVEDTTVVVVDVRSTSWFVVPLLVAKLR